MIAVALFYVGLFSKNYTENTGRGMTIVDQWMTIIDFFYEAPRTWPTASARGLRTRPRHCPAAYRRQDSPIFFASARASALAGKIQAR
jgi:hypothetical protein